MNGIICITTVLLGTFASFLWKSSLALNNGLALTPPMGWMSWQRYRCIIDCDTFPDECISEKLFKKAADLMVSEGYKDAGYEYVIIDDCWLEKNRTSDGKLQADRKRFPNGLKHLADYIHSKGLKFGLYEDYGNKTCEGYPGILGHMEVDAKSFAEWEVDYVKLDGCYSNIWEMETGLFATYILQYKLRTNYLRTIPNKQIIVNLLTNTKRFVYLGWYKSVNHLYVSIYLRYPEFEQHLNKTGRPMVYSCSWPAYQEYSGMKINYESMAKHCNLWRNYDDIQDSYSSMTNIMDYFALKQDFWQPYAGPGHWNDPDMLLIGNYGLSYEQSKTQMAVWAILAAPLLMSMDFRAIKPEFKNILLNKDVIAVNQDKLGIQGRRVYREKNIDIWVKPIGPIVGGYHSHAIAYVSRRTDGAPFSYNITLKNIGLFNPYGYEFKNLFPEDNKGNNKPIILYPNSQLKDRIAPSGCQFYRAKSLPKSEF